MPRLGSKTSLTSPDGTEEVAVQPSTGSDKSVTIANLAKGMSHTNLLDKGTNTHAQIDTHITTATNHIENTSNPHSVTAAQVGAYSTSQADSLLNLKEGAISTGTTGQYWRGDKSWQTLNKASVGLGSVDNTSDADKPVSTATQTALDGKVDENGAIVGATKTKITYDAKGLVTGGADATTADIADSLNKRYVTDAQLTVIGNTSNTNSGDQTITLTGDVTGSGTGSFATTIANDAVSNAKLANVATATFKGRTTAGTGDPEDLTATQATALLNNMVGDSGSGGTKGLAPAPASGDAAAGKYLKADGTWAVPPGGSGLSYFTEARNTSAPNATVPVHSFTATGAETNIDVALKPKGSGAITAQIADNTTAGGNKRGSYSVDLQTIRSVNTGIASGAYSGIFSGYNNSATNTLSVSSGGQNNVSSGTASFIGAGSGNTSSADFSSVTGGESNTVSSAHSNISGGYGNSVSNTHSNISGGSSNISSGQYSSVSGGLSNTASGTKSVVCGGGTVSAESIYSSAVGGFNNVSNGNYSALVGGSDNGASSIYSFVGGGLLNSVTGSYSSILGGKDAGDRSLYGVSAISSGKFSNNADCQKISFVLRKSTTNNTTSQITADAGAKSSTNHIVLQNSSIVAFKGLVVVRQNTTGDSKAWTIQGSIKRGANAASTALLGTPTVTELGADAGASAWTLACTADTTNGSLSLDVTGETSKTLRWGGSVEIMEVKG